MSGSREHIQPSGGTVPALFCCLPSCSSPILDLQPGGVFESLVRAHERKPMRPGDGGDFEVVGPHAAALNFQLMADLRVVASRLVVKRERNKGREEHFQGSQATLPVPVLFRAMLKFGLYDRAKEDVRRGLRLKSGGEAAGIFQQGNPNVGVREECHHHSARFSC